MCPWTGVEPGLAHPGWRSVAVALVKWGLHPHGAAFLRNGLLAREEMLERTDLCADRRAWYGFERELYVQAIAGTLRPEAWDA